MTLNRENNLMATTQMDSVLLDRFIFLSKLMKLMYDPLISETSQE